MSKPISAELNSKVTAKTEIAVDKSNSSVTISVPVGSSPSWQTACCWLWVGWSTVLAISLAAATQSTPSLGGFDVSGVGICNGSTINVTKAWKWTQHPDPLRVILLDTIDYLDPSYFTLFKGRNSIVWKGEDIVGFDVKSAEGTVITVEKIQMPGSYLSDLPMQGDYLSDLPMQGECHFTLDSTECQNNCDICRRTAKAHPNYCTKGKPNCAGNRIDCTGACSCQE